MDYWTNNEYYIQLYEAVGKFEAVSIIGAQARALSNMYNGQLSHAEALSWLITGNKPKGFYIRLDESEKRDRRIQLWLNDIFDTEVRSCVHSCINASLHVHNLTYIYQDGFSPYKQSRVRILTKMLWDYIH